MNVKSQSIKLIEEKKEEKICILGLCFLIEYLKILYIKYKFSASSH